MKKVRAIALLLITAVLSVGLAFSAAATEGENLIADPAPIDGGLGGWQSWFPDGSTSSFGVAKAFGPDGEDCFKISFQENNVGVAFFPVFNIKPNTDYTFSFKAVIDNSAFRWDADFVIRAEQYAEDNTRGENIEIGCLEDIDGAENGEWVNVKLSFKTTMENVYQLRIGIASESMGGDVYFTGVALTEGAEVTTPATTEAPVTTEPEDSTVDTADVADSTSKDATADTSAASTDSQSDTSANTASVSDNANDSDDTLMIILIIVAVVVVAGVAIVVVKGKKKK